MSATVQFERGSQKSTGKRVQTVLRVSRGENYVGDILLDGRNRVWRHADTIPSEIVFKALVSYTRRDETCGELVSRGDGMTYLWFVVGALAEDGESDNESESENEAA